MPIIEIIKDLRKKQKTRSEKKAIEERESMKISCIPCNEAVVDAQIHLKELANHIEIVRDMRRNREHTTKMIGGINYTIDDVEAKINSDKCWVQYHLDRYQTCCKERKLPVIEKYKC